MGYLRMIGLLTGIFALTCNFCSAEIYSKQSCIVPKAGDDIISAPGCNVRLEVKNPVPGTKYRWSNDRTDEYLGNTISIIVNPEESTVYEIKATLGTCVKYDIVKVVIVENVFCPYLEPNSKYPHKIQTSTLQTEADQEHPLHNTFEIYPNPSNGTITVHHMLKSNNGKILISDLNGRIVSEYKVSAMQDDFMINMERLSEGNYICYLLLDGVAINQRKITIVKGN